jgi:hypothetical protein
MVEPYELYPRFEKIRKIVQPYFPGFIVRVNMANEVFESAGDVFVAPFEVSIYAQTDTIPRLVGWRHIDGEHVLYSDIEALLKAVDDATTRS